jgi:preprotein translocase subunit YajC
MQEGRRQKEQRDLLSQIKPGEKIVTIGGIHGTIQSIQDDVITLVIDNKGSQLSVSKAAISMESTRMHAAKQEKNKA